MNNTRKICFVTGTRAEYGLLSLLMRKISDEPTLQLQVIVTGMHLSPEFGSTYTEIEQDGFEIDRKIELLLSADTSTSISKSVGLGIISFADAYNELSPDIIVLLGDRFEILSAATAALFAKIPIAHIHGGETTSGAYDEAIRHSITKMSWWHFVAAGEYEKRVFQLGENPKRVFNVGGLGVDNIKNIKLLDKQELAAETGLKFGKKNLLITYHPVTLENNTSKQHVQNMLDALNAFEDIYLIFTMPNADSNGRIIIQMLNDYVQDHQDRSIIFTSLGQLKYLSTLQYVDAVVGNSSSGLTEVPTFKIATVNIGDRQDGRMKASSVIDCDPTEKDISEGISRLYSGEFTDSLKTVSNPYGEGLASEKIFDLLKTLKKPSTLKKEFYDL
jgi:GDP/UDP-N,N'-diacetylbacillosamine 2-epimerase (hydrolysing)